MNELFQILGVLSLGLLAALSAGLIVRKRVGECVTFAVYVFCATLFTALILIFPKSYTPQAYLVKQGIYDGLQFGMAIELAIKVFAAFRGVADRVRGLLAGAVILSTLVIFGLTPQNAGYADLLRYQPGVTTAGIWCLAFVALLIVWYQIPVASFTRAIILGYVPYLIVFVIYVDLIARLGWKAIDGLNVLNALAYDLVAAYWAYSAWRKD